MTGKRPYRCDACAWRGWGVDLGPKFGDHDVEIATRALAPLEGLDLGLQLGEKRCRHLVRDERFREWDGIRRKRPRRAADRVEAVAQRLAGQRL